MGRKMKDSGIEWIGEIPEDWDKDKVVRIFSTIGSGTTPKSNDENYFDGKNNWIQSGDINGGILKECKTKISDEAVNKFSALKLYVSPFLIMAMYGASVGNLSISKIDGYVNQACCVLKSESSDMRYLFYSLYAARDELILHAMGSGQPNISQNTIKQLWLPFPSKKEQEIVVNFLDSKCNHINAIINKTRTSIEEYKKLKQSIITQAVTKGIRPNRKMKDSGIEWIGEIPEEWDSMNPKALFTQRKDRAKNGERQLTASQQFGVIYQDEYMERTGTKVVTVEKDFDILKHVEMGDFVISMRSFQGGLEYSEYTGSISSAYVMLIPNVELVFPHYYKWLLKSSVYINALQSTSNMVRDGQAMRYSNFAQVRLFMVPLEEQKEIANYLDVKISKINTLISKKEQLLTELENYKKSLIFEYVTG